MGKLRAGLRFRRETDEFASASGHAAGRALAIWRVRVLADGEPFQGLAGNAGDDLEVLVGVQDGKPGQFSGQVLCCTWSGGALGGLPRSARLRP
jgi:hypothetical protein